jgi:hypothetical protein
VADEGRGDFVLAQSAEGAELAQVLEGIGLALGDDAGALPALKLTGADLKDAQYVLTAIAGHSSLLP